MLPVKWCLLLPPARLAGLPCEAATSLGEGPPPTPPPLPPLQGIKGCPEHHHQGPVHRLRPRGAGVRAAAPRICESHRLH